MWRGSEAILWVGLQVRETDGKRERERLMHHEKEEEGKRRLGNSVSLLRTVPR